MDPVLFASRLDVLFSEANIWRPDIHMLARADAMLESPSDHEPASPSTTMTLEQYCKQKMDFLLDLADPDHTDDINATMREKASDLLDLADDIETHVKARLT